VLRRLALLTAQEASSKAIFRRSRHGDRQCALSLETPAPLCAAEPPVAFAPQPALHSSRSMRLFGASKRTVDPRVSFKNARL
jgi:hypothetical protein